MAVVTTARSGARFLASVGVGLLWTRFGSDVAIYTFFGALVIAVAIAGSILRPHADAHEADGSSR